MTENLPTVALGQGDENPLESWKEIAAYLKRGVRTVKRWENSEGLPVHRHMHKSRSSVYAYPSELDAWWAKRPPAEEAALESWFLRPACAMVLAAALLLALLTTGDGRLLGPTNIAAQTQGITTRQVWTGSDVDTTGAISPDGRLLTFVDWTTGDLFVRDLVNGQNRDLTNKGKDSPEQAFFSIFSPDGTQVAYAWFAQQKKKGYELRLVGIEEGAKPRVLYSNPDVGYVQPMDWSRDGKQILALFRRSDKTFQIVLVSVANGSVRVLKSLDWRSPGKMSLSPDSRYVAYDFPPKETPRARDIFVLATDGSHETALVQHAADDGFPVWTPEGDRILFVSDRTGTPSLWVSAVSQAQPKGAPQLVKADIGRLSGPMGGFTRGRAFYYSLSIPMSEVYTARLDPSVGTVLDSPAPLSQRFVGSTSFPDWSPDGKYLAYAVVGPPVSAVKTIIIRSLATGEERELKPELKQFYRPLWSPDGASFLANGYDAEGRQGLLRINAQTGAATLLARAELYVTGQAWSPNGKAVFYWDSGSLVRRNLESGEGAEVAKVPSSPRANFAVSPDGQSLVIFRDGKALEILPAKGGAARELVKLQEGEEMTLYPGTAWTPDGRYVLFTKANRKGREFTMTLWSVPAQGGEPRKIDLTMPLLRDLRVHPDGQRIAFSAGQNKNEVWVMENFLPALKSAK